MTFTHAKLKKDLLVEEVSLLALQVSAKRLWSSLYLCVEGVPKMQNKDPRQGLSLSGKPGQLDQGVCHTDNQATAP